MTHVAIDGDDIGRRLTSFYLHNDSSSLSSFSRTLNSSMTAIAALLESQGWDVLLCAADGVVARLDENPAVERLFESIAALAPPGVSFSAGIGDDLREAYIALLAAKCNGKGRMCAYADVVKTSL